MLKGGKLRESLARTRGSFFGQISGLLGASDINDELWDDLEAMGADSAGMGSTQSRGQPSRAGPEPVFAPDDFGQSDFDWGC